MIAFVALLVFPCLGVSNDNVKLESNRNIDLRVGLTSYEKDALVSGTNVTCTFNANWGALAGNTPSPSDWDQVKLISLRVQCSPPTLPGGASAPQMDELFTPPPGPISPSLTKSIRISSTEFPDVSTITFSLTAKFELTDTNAGGGTVTVTVSHTATLKAYNRLSNLATREDLNPYCIDKPLYSFSAVSKIGAANVYTLAAGPTAKIYLANHTISPLSGQVFNQSEPDLATRLRLDTFIFWFTHGTTSSMYASLTNPPAGTPTSLDGYLTWSEVSNYAYPIAAPLRTVPPINVVAAYSCETTANNGAATAFKILTPTGSPMPDRAYLGFPRVVWSAANLTAEAGIFWPLYTHAERFLQFMDDGNTCDESRKSANSRVPVCDAQGVRMDLELKGDPNSRLRYVYMSSAEWQEAKRYSWFLRL
jgi:hypothetical protein